MWPVHSIWGPIHVNFRSRQLSNQSNVALFSSAIIWVPGCMWQAHCKYDCITRTAVNEQDHTCLYANDMIYAGRIFVACRLPGAPTCPRNHKCKHCACARCAPLWEGGHKIITPVLPTTQLSPTWTRKL